jgi:hypothetical protein
VRRDRNLRPVDAHGVDECTADAAVAVGESTDGLELRVGDRDADLGVVAASGNASSLTGDPVVAFWDPQTR